MKRRSFIGLIGVALVVPLLPKAKPTPGVGTGKDYVWMTDEPDPYMDERVLAEDRRNRALLRAMRNTQDKMMTRIMSDSFNFME